MCYATRTEFVNNKIKALSAKYDFKRVDTLHPLSKIVTCTSCNGTGKEGQRKCHMCDGSKVEELRVNWVNAQSAWAVRVGDDTALIMVFWDFLTVTILKGQKGEIVVNDRLQLRNDNTGNPIHASSAVVSAPGAPGCAIPNPDKIPPGHNCYRAHKANVRDRLVSANDDIIAYLASG